MHGDKAHSFYFGKDAYENMIKDSKYTGNKEFLVIPGAEELDLKKAAKAAGEKNIAMIPAKELLPLTGYIHGGCSPIGMKKPFKTFIHETAAELPAIVFSAGKIGYQVELSLADLQKVIWVTPADLIAEK